MSEYTGPVCRGSWALGTACKRCERCIETKPSEKQDMGVVTQADREAAAAAHGSGWMVDLDKAAEAFRDHRLASQADQGEEECPACLGENKAQGEYRCLQCNGSGWAKDNPWAKHHPLCSIHKSGRCDYDCARDYTPKPADQLGEARREVDQRARADMLEVYLVDAIADRDKERREVAALREAVAGLREKYLTRAHDNDLGRKERSRCSHYVQAIDELHAALKAGGE